MTCPLSTKHHILVDQKGWTPEPNEAQTEDVKAPFQHQIFVWIDDGHSTLICIQDIITKYYVKFTGQFNHYLHKNVCNYSWVKNPFNVNTKDIPENTANTP
jgi:hypothetical protein